MANVKLKYNDEEIIVNDDPIYETYDSKEVNPLLDELEDTVKLDDVVRKVSDLEDTKTDIFGE